MASLLRFVSTAALAAAIAVPVTAQQRPAGDDDDQIVMTGCAMRAPRNSGGVSPRTLLVWSQGDVFFDVATTDIKVSETGGIPVGTTGKAAPVFYWIDDEDDLAKHVGMRIEIVGELSNNLGEGEFEVNHRRDFTEIEIDFGGKEAKARVPTGWLGAATPARDSEFAITVRRVDVEKVTVLGPCARR
jgi:hypothetical protein